MTARRALWLCWLLALGLRGLAATDTERVESAYARGVYPRIASALGCAVGRAPFSVAEAAVLAASLVACVLMLRFMGRLRRCPDRRAVLLAGLGAAVAAVGPVYLAFLLVWGLNYQRQAFAVSQGLDARPASSAELVALCRRLVAETDERRSAVEQDATDVMRLEGGLASALDRAGEGFDAASHGHAALAGPPAPAKAVRLSAVLSYLGISGVFFPFTGEPNVNATIPDPEMPFVIAHEMAHQRGFAREDEANYIASLVCRLHPDPDFRYSGSLLASVHALAALGGPEPAAAHELSRSRSEGVRRDLRALRAWSDRYRTPLLAVSGAVNDGYLRSQGQRDGVRSYGRMVDLLIAEERARRGR